MTDVVQDVTAAVEALAERMDDLLAACTDPEATDMAELLYSVQTARVALLGVERDVEAATARAMMGDHAETATLRVERHRSADRKAWDHETWRKDVRTQLLRKHGLLGAQVVSEDGELVDRGLLHTLLADAQNAHGAGAPKVTALRELGMDVRDYCESSPGVWHVKVLRMADETAEVPADA